MKYILLFSLALLLYGVQLQAQLNPNTMQDCIGAPALCFSRYELPITFRGQGQVHELASLVASDTTFCLENEENNSAWFKFEVATAGDVVFSLEPSALDDYDFAIFNLTGYTCADIVSGAAPYVRCSYALTQGTNTGLAYDSVGISAAANGNRFLSPLSVDSGEIYYIMIDNFTRNGGGFVLDFTGSTASTDYCDSIVFLMDDIEQVESLKVFSMYPNPTDQTVNVTLPYHAQLIEVVDLSGKVFLRHGNVLAGEEVTIDASHLPEGLYLVKVAHAKGIATQKLQVLH